MTTSNANTPAPATEVPKPETVTHNGVVITLKRTKTERVKKGETAVVYYTVDLDQFVPACPEEIASNETKKVEWLKSIGGPAQYKAAATVLGYDKFWTALQAKLNQDLRAAQMDAGRDNYDMPTKLANITAYITGGWGATRTAKKTPVELAMEEFQSSVAGLTAAKAAGTITQEKFLSDVGAARDKMTLRITEITAKMAADAVAS